MEKLYIYLTKYSRYQSFKFEILPIYNKNKKSKMNFEGHIEVIYGPMFSGKSS